MESQPLIPLAGGTPRAMTLSELGSVLWRRKWWVVLFALPVAFAVYSASRMVTPLYQASADLVVERGRKPGEISTETETGRVEYNVLTTQKDILLSDAVLRETIKRTNAAERAPYSLMRDPTAALAGRVRASVNRDSWVMTVTLRDEDPRRAEEMLRALLLAFRDHQFQVNTTRAQAAFLFLTQQVDESRKLLAAARQAEQDFRTSQAIILVDPNNNQIAQQLSQIMRERTELDQRLAQIESLVTRVQATDAEASPAARQEALLRVDAIGTNATVVERLRAVRESEEHLATLAEKYLEQHPRYREALVLQDRRRQQLGEVILQVRSALEGERSTLRETAAQLDGQLKKLEGSLNKYRADLIRLMALSEETLSRQRVYEALLNQQAQVKVRAELDGSQVYEVDPPRASEQPVNTPRRVFALAGLFLGTIVGIAAALVAERRDRRVHRVEIVARRTGLPILGVVPHTSGLGKPGTHGEDAKGDLGEAFRALRAAVRLGQPRRGCRVVTVTAAQSNDGASTVASRLAHSLALGGQRTLLIDANLRHPNLHRLWDIAPGDGLAECLATDGSLVVHTSAIRGLEIVAGGAAALNASELLLRPVLPRIIDEMLSEYVFIVLDAPPLGEVADALSLCALSDIVLLVVREGATRRDVLAQTLDRLAPHRRQVAGLVANGVQRPVSELAGMVWVQPPPASNEPRRERGRERRPASRLAEDDEEVVISE